MRGEVCYTPWIRKFGIRQIQVGPEFDYFFKANNELETRDIQLGSRIELDNGVRLCFGIQRTKERLDEDLDIQTEVIIPIGDYECTSFRASIDTDDSKIIAGRFGVTFGDFFNGARRGFDIDTSFKPSGRFVLKSQYQFDRVYLSGVPSMLTCWPPTSPIPSPQHFCETVRTVEQLK